MVVLAKWGMDSNKYSPIQKFFGMTVSAIFMVSAVVILGLVDVINLGHIKSSSYADMISYSHHFLYIAIYLFIAVSLYCFLYYRQKENKTGNLYRVGLMFGVHWGLAVGVLINLMGQLFISMHFVRVLNYPSDELWQGWLSAYLVQTLIIAFFIFGIRVLKFFMASSRMDVQRDQTSQNLGAARMADDLDYQRFGLRSKEGTLLGEDDGYLRYPLTDRLVMGFRGSMKTTAVLMPMILEYPNTNMYITDIKGEIAAVTARRRIASGRTVYIHDAFRILKDIGCGDLPICAINPLAGINWRDEDIRDRCVNSLASALLSSPGDKESDTSKHFSDFAQIIMEGVLDHYIGVNMDTPTHLNLVAFHDWWLRIVSEKDGLSELGGSTLKAKAAYAHLAMDGADETTSMKTSVYRQLMWLRSSSVREAFKGDKNIRDFATEDCDIYVVLPEDAVKNRSLSRIFRVLLATIKDAIVQTPISKLKSQYLLMLDELGQQGYLPDVEQAVATLRARGVYTWGFFQTLGQLDKYQDEATFKGMPVIQFLRTDDPKSMEWIQKIAGKTTVLAEGMSQSTSFKSDRSSPMISLNEQAKDLLDINDIRTLSKDEQFIFIPGIHPIKCKKAQYFKLPHLKNMFDPNPYEDKEGFAKWQQTQALITAS